MQHVSLSLTKEGSTSRNCTREYRERTERECIDKYVHPGCHLRFYEHLMFTCEIARSEILTSGCALLIAMRLSLITLLSGSACKCAGCTHDHHEARPLIKMLINY